MDFVSIYEYDGEEYVMHICDVPTKPKGQEHALRIANDICEIKNTVFADEFEAEQIMKHSL